VGERFGLKTGGVFPLTLTTAVNAQRVTDNRNFLCPSITIAV